MDDSNDSLLWSETSQHSSSNTTTPNKMNESDEDLEQKYKKELLQDVFKEPKLENDYELSSKKKKKNKEKLDLSIKSEPESDLESIKKKKKSKRKSSINESHYESKFQDEDSYLDLCVKEENLMSPTDSSKKRKKKKKAEHESFSPNDEKSEITLENSDVKKKSNKKKKHKYEEQNESVVKELFSADETIVGTYEIEDENPQPKKHKKKKNKKRDISPIEVNHNGYHTDQENVISVDVVDDAMIVDEPHNVVQNCNSLVISTAKPKQSRITDRLLFEDDLQAQKILDTSENSSQSIKLRQFLKSEGNLQPCDINYPDELSISPNDNVFLLHCPTEVDISHLYDLSLSLDGTCRIKVGGQKYESIVDNNNGNNVTLLLFEDQEHKIKSFPCAATIHFRKRLPKAHFVMDNIIENEQTNFIPLPETKSRHPLFGPNYKKAIKLPTEIKERLQNEPTQEPTPQKKKKKKHSNKEDLIVEDQEKMGEGKLRRKRKQSGTGSISSKRARLPPTWEDEQAIEQNLFDY